MPSQSRVGKKMIKSTSMHLLTCTRVYYMQHNFRAIQMFLLILNSQIDISIHVLASSFEDAEFGI